jgi:hypothetical protein
MQSSNAETSFLGKIIVYQSGATPLELHDLFVVSSQSHQYGVASNTTAS